MKSEVPDVEIDCAALTEKDIEDLFFWFEPLLRDPWDLDLFGTHWARHFPHRMPSTCCSWILQSNTFAFPSPRKAAVASGLRIVGRTTVRNTTKQLPFNHLAAAHYYVNLQPTIFGVTSHIPSEYIQNIPKQSP